MYARLIMREVEQRDIDPSPLFDGIALGRDELMRGGDIRLADFLHVLRTGDRLLSGEQLGFLLGRKMHVFAMGPVGAGLALAPSLRDGLQLLEGYARLHATYINIVASSTTRGLTVRILYERETGYVERLHTQTAVMLLQQYLESVLGAPINDVRYRFAMPESDDSDEYRAALSGIVEFGAEANEVCIPHRWLDLPSPFYHAELWHQAQISLARSLKEQSETKGTPFTQHVSTLLRTSDTPIPDMADVAFRLHISGRTLNRHLRAENTSFRQLKSRALASHAKLYLRETDHSVEAIAGTLGYRDTANFRRAFRKSVGCSPNEYRISMKIADS